MRFLPPQRVCFLRWRRSNWLIQHLLTLEVNLDSEMMFPLCTYSENHPPWCESLKQAQMQPKYSVHLIRLTSKPCMNYCEFPTHIKTWCTYALVSRALNCPSPSADTDTLYLPLGASIGAQGTQQAECCSHSGFCMLPKGVCLIDGVLINDDDESIL